MDMHTKKNEGQKECDVGVSFDLLHSMLAQQNFLDPSILIINELKWKFILEQIIEPKEVDKWRTI